MNTRNQKQITVAAMLLVGLTTAAEAGHGPKSRADRGADRFAVEAPVLDVEPLVRVVQVTVPQEVCWQEPVRHTADSGYRSATPTVLGAIIGGVAGNQFGSGSGNKVMTAAGALLGGSIGRDMANRRRQAQASYVTYERVCDIEQVSHEEERIDGYRVTYEYAGREFVTQTPVDPGETIRVRVQVQPLDYN